MSNSVLDDTAILAISLSTGIIATTVHAQDFPDMEGDSRVGRKTLPIIAPQHARKTVIVGLLAWSIALTNIWQLDLVSGAALAIFSTVIGIRFLVYKSVKDDQLSYLLYNVSAAHSKISLGFSYHISPRYGCHALTCCPDIEDFWCKYLWHYEQQQLISPLVMFYSISGPECHPTWRCAQLVSREFDMQFSTELQQLQMTFLYRERLSSVHHFFFRYWSYSYPDMLIVLLVMERIALEYE